jgi:endonuclease YncB( thermonuclease family)
MGESQALIKVAVAAFVLLPCLVLAAPEESYGQVIKVLDGETIEVAIQKADPRILYAVEMIRLADVSSPELDTPAGLLARDFTYAVLMNKMVFLDIDDLSGNGRDASGRLVSLVYLTGSYGQPIPAPNFNRMLVDSGYAVLQDSRDNEFQPADWWSKAGSLPVNGSQVNELLQEPLKSIIQPLQDAAASEFEKRAKQTADWLRGQG